MLLLLVLLVLLLSVPAVQTRLATYATEKVNSEFGTDITIQKVDLSFLGTVGLKGIAIKDHKKDTLIYADKLATSIINAKNIFDNNLNLGDVTLSGVKVLMKTYKGDKDDTMSMFIDSFDDGSPKDSTAIPFILKTDNIYIDDLEYHLIDENKRDKVQFSARKAGGGIQNFSLIGPEVRMDVRGLYLIDDRNINVRNLTTDFFYSKSKMEFKNTTLATDNYSKIKGDIFFTYKREDFENFTDKVRLKGRFKSSKLSVKDLRKFYGELSGDDMLRFTGKASGTLNNLSLTNLNLYSKQGIQIKGDLGFVNSFNTDRGFVFDGDIDKVKANYEQLKTILPNVLGSKLPSDFKKLGDFTLSGLMKITPDQIEATLNVDSAIGGTISDLQLTDIADINNAKYSGEVEFVDLDLGKLTNDPILGKISLKADVDGSGFAVDHISSTIIGEVSQIEFNGYTYQNLDVNGEFENRKFDGFLKADDEHFKLQFEGLADFSSEIYKFNFDTKITEVDLKKTNLFTRDSISVLKGNIKLNGSGNSIDNIVGKAVFKDVSYTNQKKSYDFKKFEISSQIVDSIQTIKVDSDDIVKGRLKGHFKFKELFPVAQNALWGTYSNYQPIAVSPNQFISFDFEIYNQIVDVFLPEVSIGENTKIRGRIDGNKNAVKLIFNSPKVNVHNNVADTLNLRIDNKNKLYNTHLTAKKIATKYYDVHQLNLINRTKNDTLFFKSTFKGGKQKAEDFSMDFFYTLNPDQKSVIGLQKSDVKFKGSHWFVNKANDGNNKLTFDLLSKTFDFSPFLIQSGKQKIAFSGTMKDGDKNLQASFDKVSLTKIMPEIEGLQLEGVLNGTFDVVEENGVAKPLADIVVNDLIVNEFSQGTLKAKVNGIDSYEKFVVDVSIRDYLFDNVKVEGVIDTSVKESLNLNVKFNKYELNGFSDLFGNNAISDLRGLLSGDFKVKGDYKNPSLDGFLSLEKSGLTVPYLNIDFDFVENTTVNLKDKSFVFEKMLIEDTKYATRGFLSGLISHENFLDWYLDLKISSDNLLVLDTKEVEDIPYYGKGFINGYASLKGETNNLDIDVRGKTNKETLFVIPISDVSSVESYKLIHFKQNNDNVFFKNKTNSSRLNLNIDLEVTKDAVAQVVLDKINKSELKGSGTGNLKINIDTQGDFKMEGGLLIDNGVYNFRYTGIPKDFEVQSGGTISWSGDPYNADLDLVAIYKAKGNPAQLLDNVTSSYKIPVNLYTKITGSLFNSKQEFDIKIPNADSNVASELEFKFENDTNTKMLNFASLLLGNTFYNQEASVDFASSIATSTASDVLSNVLSNMINSEDGKFKLNVGYTQSDNGSLSGVVYDDQVDLSLSSQLTDRLIFNGRVGVPVGANSQFQSGVVGEANLEVLLNEEGTFRWKIFNKPNDIQYSIEEEGYTQGTGFSYQVNFDNFNELIKELKLKKNKINKVQKDTLNIDKLINFAPIQKDSITPNNEKN